MTRKLKEVSVATVEIAIEVAIAITVAIDVTIVVGVTIAIGRKHAVAAKRIRRVLYSVLQLRRERRVAHPVRLGRGNVVAIVGSGSVHRSRGVATRGRGARTVR